MQIQLHSPARRIAVLLATVLVGGSFATIAFIDFLASHISKKPTLANLEQSARLEPWNADYRDRLGQLYSLQDPEAAIKSFRRAVSLNPHRSAYWLDLFAVYVTRGDAPGQHDALEHAVAAEPTNPTAAWIAANSYILQNKPDRALEKFGIVIGNDPAHQALAIQQVWRLKPDAPFLLANVFPATADSRIAFLSFLAARQETAATLQVWANLAALKQPLPQPFVFGYVSYLLQQKKIEDAVRVWSEASYLAGLENYQPSSENLIVNGDFSFPVLNGGFDWNYARISDVSLALDPVQSFSGHHSLLITLEKARLSDVGIQQWVPVLPNKHYAFSAHFRTESMEGAGGLRFTLYDALDGKPCFSSEDLKNAEFWKEVGGEFTSSPETRLLLLRIQRDPPGSPIQGKLWIDGLRLTEKRQD